MALSLKDQKATYNAAIQGGLDTATASSISGYTPPVATPTPQTTPQPQRTQQTYTPQPTYQPPQKTPQQIEAERAERERQTWIATAEAFKGSGAGSLEVPGFIERVPERFKQDATGVFGAPITPQTIEDGIKNLPTQLSPTQIDQYYKEEGSKATPLSPLDWLQKKTVGTTQDSNIITTDTSRDASPIEIATDTSSTTKADSTAAGADTTAKSIQDYIALLTPPETEESGTISDLMDTISTELNDLKGRGTAQLSAEEAQGVEIKKQILQNAETELNQKLAEYKAIQAKYEALNADIEGKAITMSSIVGSQAQVNRTMRAELNVKASEIAMIQANVASAQGNLNLAQDAADRAVDLKYEDAKDAIEIRLQQLELLQDELSKDEQIRTDAIELYLNQQTDTLDIQKANEKDTNVTLLNLMQKYNDAGITLNDSIESANRKITTNSAIYRKEINITGGDSTTNPGGYSEQEKRKLRNEGIDPTNVSEADEFLYGDDEKPLEVFFNEQQMTDIATAYIKKVGKEQFKNMIEQERKVRIEDDSGKIQEIELSDEQVEQFVTAMDSLSDEDVEKGDSAIINAFEIYIHTNILIWQSQQ